MLGARSQPKCKPYSQRAPTQWGERQVNHHWILSGECHTEGREEVPEAVWVREVGFNWVLQNGRVIEMVMRATLVGERKHTCKDMKACDMEGAYHKIYAEYETCLNAFWNFVSLQICLLLPTPPRDWTARDQACSAMVHSHLTLIIHLVYATFLWTLSTLRKLRHRTVKLQAQGHTAEQGFEPRQSGSSACAVKHCVIQ